MNNFFKKKRAKKKRKKNTCSQTNPFLLLLLFVFCCFCFVFLVCFFLVLKRTYKFGGCKSVQSRQNILGGGSDWDWSECAAGGSKSIPISRGNFSNYSCPFLGNFSDNRHPFPRILPEKHTNFSKISGLATLKNLERTSKILKNRPMSWDS